MPEGPTSGEHVEVFLHRCAPNIDDPENLIRTCLIRIKRVHTSTEGNRFDHRTEVASIIWTLMFDETPIYAIVPSGSFAFESTIRWSVSCGPISPEGPRQARKAGSIPRAKADQKVFGEAAERVSIPG